MYGKTVLKHIIYYFNSITRLKSVKRKKISRLKIKGFLAKHITISFDPKLLDCKGIGVNINICCSLYCLLNNKNKTSDYLVLGPGATKNFLIINRTPFGYLLICPGH